MVDVVNTTKPIYGKSYQGTYYFRIRKATREEATLHEFDGLTIDVIILTVTDQPRVIVATPMAAGHTYNYPDAKLITKEEWDNAATEIFNILTAITNE